MVQGGFIYKSSRDCHIKCGGWNLIKISTRVQFYHKNIWYSLTTFTLDNYTDYNKVCSCTFSNIVVLFISTWSHELSLILNITQSPMTLNDFMPNLKQIFKAQLYDWMCRTLHSSESNASWTNCLLILGTIGHRIFNTIHAMSFYQI